jgi:hypothetical protein
MEPGKALCRRCAIYTRKSSEEGLEQDFNSLHAQREACEAYIKSQQGEGWRLVQTTYDDGGLSGATVPGPLDGELELVAGGPTPQATAVRPLGSGTSGRMMGAG